MTNPKKLRRPNPKNEDDLTQNEDDLIKKNKNDLTPKYVKN